MDSNAGVLAGRRNDQAILWALLSVLAVLGATIALAYLAANELTAGAALTVFSFSWCLFAMMVLWTRRPLSMSLLVTTPIVAIVALNHLKYQYLREIIHPIDLYLLFSWARSDIGFVLAYGRMFALGLAGLLALVLLVVLAWGFETIARPLGRRIRVARLGIIVLGVVGLATAIIFFKSNYLEAVRSISYYSQLTSNTGVRLSYLISSFDQLRTLQANFATSASSDTIVEAGGLGLPGGDCGQCPDIIVYHAESVFDPRMLEAFVEKKPLWEYFGDKLSSRSGFLRTNVFGGLSMMSEFEMMCGVYHNSFGLAGAYPNLFLQPFIQNCGPRLLRDAGYETIALYSTPASVNHVGNMFAAYGVQQFADATALKLPHQWHLMRDKLLVDAAMKILTQPRKRPRFIWISTMYNHGPHSASRIETRFPGPYEIDRVTDGATSDYLNRLNDSLGQMQALEEFVAALPTRTAILYYGDHQPNLTVTYSAAAQAQHGATARFITFYRWATNWDSAKGVSDGPLIRIEDQLGEFLSYVGFSNTNHLRRISRFVKDTCGGEPRQCTEDARRKLRSFVGN